MSDSGREWGANSDEQIRKRNAEKKKAIDQSAALVMFLTAVERLLGDAEKLRAAKDELLSTETDSKTRIRLEDVEKWMQFANEIDSIPLRDIEWTRGGVAVDVPAQGVADYAEAGLRNCWFPEMAGLIKVSNENT